MAEAAPLALAPISELLGDVEAEVALLSVEDDRKILDGVAVAVAVADRATDDDNGGDCCDDGA